MRNSNGVWRAASDPVNTPEFVSRLEGARQSGQGWTAKCPAHDDRHPSLSIGLGDDGRVLVNCFNGCTPEEVVGALGLRMADLFESRSDGSRPSSGQAGDKVTGNQSDVRIGLDMATLASAKRLPVEVLRDWGVTDGRRNGVPYVVIPYFDADGETKAIRSRTALTGAQRFHWRKNDRVALYGLGKLEDIRREGWVLFAEGESDTWTGWHHGVPVLGLPGKTTWQSTWAENDADVSP